MASPSRDCGSRAFISEDLCDRETESLSQQSTFAVFVDLPEVVQTALVSLWKDDKYTDITFLINGHRIPAHKAILASQSEYFDRMLFGEMKEAFMNEIPLEDVSLETFQRVLQFVYSGTLRMEGVALQAILEVVAAADLFRFVALKEALGDQLSGLISFDTVIPLLVHSDTYRFPDLHNKCFCFIEDKANTVAVLQSSAFLWLSEGSLIKIISRDTLVAPELAIFKAVVQWKEHNSSGVEQTARVLQHIRLGELSLQEIVMEVEPTKLFSQESIMRAMRLQYTPSITENQGRGRKEANQNLFEKPEVVFKSKPSNVFRQSRQFYSSTLEIVANTVIQLSSLSSRKRDSSGSEKLDHCTMIVSLHDVYIVNYLHMRGYPGVPDENQKCKSFSYTVEVSRDKSNWLKLFDYSSFACRGAQNLPFPKQAVKYIKVTLTGKEDTQPVPLQLCTCCYTENQDPFKFLPKGVIAPQNEQKVVTVPSTGTIDNNPVYVAYFNQPYSVSRLKFQLNCSDPNVVEVDITVSVGVHNNLDDMHVLKDIKRTALQSPIVVETQERGIEYVAVTIKKVHKNVDSSEDGRPGYLGSTAPGTVHLTPQFVQGPSHRVNAGPVFKIADVFCSATI